MNTIRNTRAILCYILLLIFKQSLAKISLQMGVVSYDDKLQTSALYKCCSDEVKISMTPCKRTCKICMTIDLVFFSLTNTSERWSRRQVSILNSSVGVTTTVNQSIGMRMFEQEFHTWPSRWNVSLKLYQHRLTDITACDTGKIIEEVKSNFTMATTNDRREENHSLSGKNFTFTLTTRLGCSPRWHGNNCDVHCTPHDDVTGHYSCHNTSGVKICKDNYYGDNCTRYCRGRDDGSGHFICGRLGEVVCMNGWSDRGSNCITHVMELCPSYYRWVYIKFETFQQSNLMNPVKDILCRSINTNCFGEDMCPSRESGNQSVTLDDLHISKVKVRGREEMKMMMVVDGNRRCIRMNETCLRLSRLPSGEPVKVIKSWKVIFAVGLGKRSIKKRFRTLVTTKKTKSMLYALISLFALAVVILGVAQIAKSKKILTAPQPALTPNVTKRSRI